MNRNLTSMEERVRRLSNDQTELLKWLLREKSKRKEQIRPRPRDDQARRVRLPPSWAQQRLWFIDQLGGGGSGYNIPVAIRMRGLLDYESLREALNGLVRRHEVLRTIFVNAEGESTQEIASEGHFALAVVDLAWISTAH